MGIDFEYIQGQTPPDAGEMDGLLIPSISTRGALDEFGQQNMKMLFNGY